MCEGNCGKGDELSEQLNRRDFLNKTALAALIAAVATACGDGQIGGGSITDDGTTSGGATGGATGSGKVANLKISDYAALGAVGGIVRLSSNVGTIAVVRTGTAAFLALSMRCPHEGTTINVSGSGFRCPSHGATFTATGTWTGGQRTTSLRSYTTSYDATTGILAVG